MTNQTSTILHYQRLSTEDGPGIRTTVFFKGCPLSCLWCHNPESIDIKPQLQWIESRCIGCNSCIETCDQHVLSRKANKLTIDRVLCSNCNRCVEECPTNALEMLGTKINTDQLMDEVLKDLTYYQKSDGGVTLSGGEPTLQSAFLCQALSKLKDKDIHTALDTCGLCNYQTLEKSFPYLDLILFDIKTINPQLHQQFTGHSNERILNNFIKLMDFLKRFPSEFELWIRTPLIPKSTAIKGNLEEIARFLIEHGLNQISRWELCAFNNLCNDKYLRLDQKWTYENEPLMTREQLDQCHQWVVDTGFPADKVIVTGASRIEKILEGAMK